jgi:hypothetical protein
MRFSWCVAVASLLMAFLPASASANGRFPRAQRLIESPSNGDELTLAATYGILVSHDRGKNWYFVCETAFASQTLTGIDVTVEMTSDGNLLAGIFSSIRASGDKACSWRAVLPEKDGQSVPDLLVSKSASDVAIAVTAADVGVGARSVELKESLDKGNTWNKLGASLPSDFVYALTVDEAPSDPSRLYVSGINKSNQGVLVRSTDRGKTWKTLNILTTSQSDQPYIAAVHPTNPDIVFVRTSGITQEFEEAASDALIYSTNGGDDWKEITRKQAKLFGFALSPDAKTLLLGYGDLLEAGIAMDPGAFGIYKADTAELVDDSSLTQIYAGAINCLTWTKKGVYACTAQAEAGFALGFRADAAFTLETKDPFAPLLKQPEIKGPQPCPKCTNGTFCDADWAATCVNIGACAADGGAAGAAGIDPECGGAGSGGIGGTLGAAGSGLGSGGTGNSGLQAGGTGNATSTAGTSSGRAGSGGTGAGNSNVTPESDDAGSDCGCRVPGHAQGNALALAVAALLLRTLRRKRRAHHS